MKRLLITGGCGFIGSNFVQYMLETHDDIQIINVDALTYAGNLENLKHIETHPRYTFIKANISILEQLAPVFLQHSPHYVVNFAAESHVDRSIMDPDVFIRTNIQGTHNLLVLSRKHTIDRFVQISTDEVYGSVSGQRLFTEEDPLYPNSPYSASKAGADMLVRAYYKTYGLPAIITRCSNNFGPYQFPEKLIGLTITNALENKKIPVYGDGLHVRDWLFVKDHCRGIDTVLQKGTNGEIYNIGCNNEIKNIDIIQKVLALLGKPQNLIDYVDDRPGHDRRYALDISKISRTLGWSPSHDFDTAMDRTISWYCENRQWWQNIRSGAYLEYYRNQYEPKGHTV